jgi:hypothetical protein
MAQGKKSGVSKAKISKAKGNKAKGNKAKRSTAKGSTAKRSTPSKTNAGLFSLDSHPATAAMTARVTGCNKPPILWRKIGNSWMECFLKSDCTYGNCQEVDESQVPEAIRSGAS